MFMYLLQCCRQPWQDDQYDADPKLWYTRSFVPNTYRNHSNRQTTGNDTFVRRKTYYTPARGNDIDSEFNDSSSFSYGLHASRIVSKRSSSDSSDIYEREMIKNYAVNVTRNYYVQRTPSIEFKTSNQSTRILHDPTFFTVNMAIEKISNDPNWEKVTSIDIELINNRSSSIKQANIEIVVDHSLLFRQNVKYESQPTIYFHQSAVQQSNTDSLNYAVIQDHPPSIINEIYSSTSSEMSGHDSESIYLTIRSLKLENQSTELSTDIDEYHNAGIDEVKFNFKELVRIHKPNEPYKEFFLTSALSSLPIFPENETDQSDHIIQDTVHIQPIQTILESIDNSEASALPVSSRVRYNKQPEIHY